MNTGLVLGILAAAFGASWYTAHAAGRFWTESKLVGGPIRFLVICSLVTSAIGFTGVYLMALLLLASAMSVLPSYLDISPFYPVSLGILGMPGAGAVPNLWLDNRVAMRRRQLLGSMAAPGFNLPIHPADMLDMTLRTPRLFEWIGGLLKGGGKSGGGGDSDSDSGKLFLILIVIAVVVLAISAGVVTTILIVQSADREHVGEIFDIYQSAKVSPT